MHHAQGEQDHDDNVNGNDVRFPCQERVQIVSCTFRYL